MATTGSSGSHTHTYTVTAGVPGPAGPVGPAGSAGAQGPAGPAADLTALTARVKAIEDRLGSVVVPPPVVPPPVTPPPVIVPGQTTITVPAGGKGVVINRDGQIIENLLITGPGSATYDGKTWGIYGEGAFRDVVIRHCTIRGIGHSGIWPVGLVNLTIEDCLIEDVAYSGIYLVGVTGGTIRRNKIHRIGNDGKSTGVGNNAYGIAVGGIGKISSDVLVEDNEVTDVPMWHGLDTHGGLRITFRHNTVRRTPRAIFVTSLSIGKSTDCVIERNLFTEPVEVTGGTDKGWATTASTVRCAFTGNVVGSAYGAPTVYDYGGQSTGLVQSGNVTGEALP